MQDCRLFQLIFVTHACPTSTAVLTIGHNISFASSDGLTDSDLQTLIETEQDRTRHSFTQYFKIIIYLCNYALKRQSINSIMLLRMSDDMNLRRQSK